MNNHTQHSGLNVDSCLASGVEWNTKLELNRFELIYFIDISIDFPIHLSFLFRFHFRSDGALFSVGRFVFVFYID